MLNHRKVSTASERMLELMHEYSMNQSDFAKKTGVNKSTISRCMNNTFSPNQETIEKISSAFNVDAAWLMGFDVPQKNVVLNKVDTDTLTSITVGDNADLWEIIIKLTQLSADDRKVVLGVIESCLASKS